MLIILWSCSSKASSRLRFTFSSASSLEPLSEGIKIFINAAHSDASRIDSIERKRSSSFITDIKVFTSPHISITQSLKCSLSAKASFNSSLYFFNPFTAHSACNRS